MSFHWIWRPALMLNTRHLHMIAIPRNGGVSCDISLIRLHFVELLPCIYGVCMWCFCTTLVWLDEDVCVGHVNTMYLGPREQPVSGIAWLRIRAGWNNPPNPIWDCPLSPGIQSAPGLSHLSWQRGAEPVPVLWMTRKWRVLVINTRQQEQDVQIT